MKIVGYYEDDNKSPVAVMNGGGIIVFTNDKKVKQYKKLGGTKELHKILSNVEYYKMGRNSVSVKSQRGGGGLFGESQGKCGWGNSPDCCFFGCSPMWRTHAWPLDISL
jgi:hypothetical protein